MCIHVCACVNKGGGLFPDIYKNGHMSPPQLNLSDRRIHAILNKDLRRKLRLPPQQLYPEIKNPTDMDVNQLSQPDLSEDDDTLPSIDPWCMGSTSPLSFETRKNTTETQSSSQLTLVHNKTKSSGGSHVPLSSVTQVDVPALLVPKGGKIYHQKERVQRTKIIKSQTNAVKRQRPPKNASQYNLLVPASKVHARDVNTPHTNTNFQHVSDGIGNHTVPIAIPQPMQQQHQSSIQTHQVHQLQQQRQQQQQHPTHELSPQLQQQRHQRLSQHLQLQKIDSLSLSSSQTLTQNRHPVDSHHIQNNASSLTPQYESYHIPQGSHQQRLLQSRVQQQLVDTVQRHDKRHEFLDCIQTPDEVQFRRVSDSQGCIELTNSMQEELIDHANRYSHNFSEPLQLHQFTQRQQRQQQQHRNHYHHPQRQQSQRQHHQPRHPHFEQRHVPQPRLQLAQQQDSHQQQHLQQQERLEHHLYQPSYVPQHTGIQQFPCEGQHIHPQILQQPHPIHVHINQSDLRQFQLLPSVSLTDSLLHLQGDQQRLKYHFHNNVLSTPTTHTNTASRSFDNIQQMQSLTISADNPQLISMDPLLSTLSLQGMKAKRSSPTMCRKCWLCVLYGKTDIEKCRMQMRFSQHMGKLAWADGHSEHYCPSLDGQASPEQAAAAKQAWSKSRSRKSKFHKYYVEAMNANSDFTIV